MVIELKKGIPQNVRQRINKSGSATVAERFIDEQQSASRLAKIVRTSTDRLIQESATMHITAIRARDQ